MFETIEISPYIMIGVGALLMAAELAFFSFYLLFFGLGFVIVGVVNFWLPSAWYHQIWHMLFVSLALLFFFRSWLLRKFGRSQGFKEDFLDEEGLGVVREGMIYYKGTLWHYDGDEIEEGRKVKVLKTRGNHVILDI